MNNNINYDDQDIFYGFGSLIDLPSSWNSSLSPSLSSFTSESNKDSLLNLEKTQNAKCLLVTLDTLSRNKLNNFVHKHNIKIIQIVSSRKVEKNEFSVLSSKEGVTFEAINKNELRNMLDGSRTRLSGNIASENAYKSELEDLLNSIYSFIPTKAASLDRMKKIQNDILVDDRIEHLQGFLKK